MTFDALAADRMSLYGNPRPSTPNLDALGEKSYVFERMHAESDATPQSMLSIHTGKHYHIDDLSKHGSVDAGGETIGSMPEFFNRLGWDAVYGFPKPWNQGEIFTLIGAYNDDYKLLIDIKYGGRLKQALLRLDLRYPKLPMAWLDFLHGTYIQPYVVKWSSPSEQLGFGFYCSSEEGIMHSFASGQKYLEERKRNSSFLWIHQMAPHEPFCPVPGFYGKFSDSDKSYSDIVHSLDFRDLPIPPENEDLMYIMQLRYEEFLLAADAQFGKFLQSLKESGRFDDSMIIITADHGQAFKKGDIWNSTRVMYEQTARVPLIIHMPGQEKGKRISTLAHHVDIMPTIIETLGYSPPDWMDGESLWKYINDDTSGESRVIVSRVLPTLQGFFANEIYKHIHTFLVYKGQYKLIYRYYGDDELNKVDPPESAQRYFNAFPHVELFDLERDPEENENLADQKREVRDELMEIVRQEIEEVRRLRGLSKNN